MPLIRRLPGLQEDVKHALAQKVPTLEEYLLEEPVRIGESNGIFNDQAHSTLDDYIAAHVAPPATNGAALLEQLRDRSRLLPIGLPCVDELLHGGIREGQHLEMVGESGSAKTQLCLLACMTTAVRGEGVVYIDTGASFSPRRMATLFRHCPAAQQGKMGLGALVEAFDRVTVYRAHDIHTLLAILDHLSLTLQAAEQARADGVASSPAVTLLVVDSPAAVIAPVLGGGNQHSQGHALMMAVARMLRSLARRYNVAVLTTNHMVGGGGPSGNQRPALGESWRNQAHVRLQLARVPGPDDGARLAILKASSIGPCNQVARFTLANTGAVQSC